MSWLGAMYVVVGGAFGALCRYALISITARFYVGDFPMGTFLVNVIGSFLIGVWIAYVAYTLPERARELNLLVAVGALGGFTTFSAFSRDIFAMMYNQDILHSFINVAFYVGASVALSVLALMGGMRLMRYIFS